MNEGKRFTRNGRLAFSWDISFPDFQGTWGQPPCDHSSGMLGGKQTGEVGKAGLLGRGEAAGVSQHPCLLKADRVKDKSHWKQPKIHC